MKRIPGEWRYFDEELGIPFPWYTKPALEVIKTWNLEGKTIFEYGVGDSTTWFRKRGAEVFGVDNDQEWSNKLKVSFQHYMMDYLQTITCFPKGNQFDIVCIDGAWRDECTSYALYHLKPGGFLIIDNYKQVSVPFIWTKTEKLIEGMTAGFYKEPEHEDWVTAIIYKSK